MVEISNGPFIELDMECEKIENLLHLLLVDQRHEKTHLKII